MSPYKVFGLPDDAAKWEVRTEFYKLRDRREAHDIDDEAWQTITEAYKTITGISAHTEKTRQPKPAEVLTKSDEAEFAGFWIRALAFIIDYAIIMVFNMMFGFFLGLVTAILGISLKPISIGFYLFSFVVSYIFMWLYEAIQTSSPMHGTFGKWVLGLKVVDTEFKEITFLRATARFWIKAFNWSWLVIPFTEKKQGLHDMVADTYVIRDKKGSHKPSLP